MRRILFSSLISLLVSTSPFAGTDIKVSGQVRVRAELDKRGFGSNALTYTPSYGRIRFTADALVDSNVHAVIQLQDSRVFGGRSTTGEFTSGTLSDAHNVDLHQGYLELPHLIGQNIGMRAGRFEIAWHNERVMGAVDWNNVGRSWEGAMFWYHGENFALDGGAMDARREFLPDEERSLFVAPINASFKPYKFDVFAVIDMQALQTPDKWYGDTRYTVGAYTKQQATSFDLELVGAYQFGRVPPSLPARARGRDASGYLLFAEVGYNFPDYGKLRVAAGVDYASGDDDATDTDNNAFDNLYYTGHKFRGYMDYFAGVIDPQFRGLMDVYGRLRFEPVRGWTAGADFHYFQTAVEYAGVDDNLDPALTRDVGWELDVVASTARVIGARLEGGFSVFSPTESFSGLSDPELGLWGYSAAIVNF